MNDATNKVRVTNEDGALVVWIVREDGPYKVAVQAETCSDHMFKQFAMAVANCYSIPCEETL